MKRRIINARKFFVSAVLVVLLCVAPFSALADFDAPPPGNDYFPPPDNPLQHPITMPQSPQSWRSSMLFENTLTRRQEGIDIRGFIPEIDESFTAAYELNNYISENIFSSLVAEARRLRARSISFSFDYYPSNDIISIVIYAEVAATLPHTLVRSVNFCAYSGRIVSMNEAVGMEIIPLAERILSEIIRSNPEHYYAALSAPLEEQAFYLTADSLMISFDGFRLSTRVGEVDTIEIFLPNISTAFLSPFEYRADGPYGLKMIPLRSVLEYQLGYEVDWDDYENRVVIRRNGRDIITLRPDDNEYTIHGTQRRSLEAPPQIIDDIIYVPITFFDQVLPFTTFSFDFNGNITFLSYFMG